MSIFEEPIYSAFEYLNSLLNLEKKRLFESINLIASENLPSKAVLEAVGSVFSVKYAEGYPGNRYYGGCEFVDRVETQAIELAKKLFDMEFANVQPHSGAQANQAVFESILKDGDKILSLSLDHGGHLTHGHKVNFSGKRYNVVFYPLDPKTYLIDLNLVEEIAKKEKPRLIIAGASAYSREIDFDAFRDIADSVGAYLLADVAHYAGLIVAGIYPSPKRAHFVTSTTHKTLRGPRGGIILSQSSFANSINRAVFPFLQGGPHMNSILAKAVCFEICQTTEFKQYAEKVVLNAKELARHLILNDLNVITGGTSSHMFLVDVVSIGLTGIEAQSLLEEAGIYVNKNTIPYDKNPPAVCSGIRIGTPMITSLGLEVSHMAQVAEFIVKVLKERQAPDNLREEVRQFCIQNFKKIF